MSLSTLYDCLQHTRCTRLATFSKLPSGKWRAQGRRRGRYLGETFSCAEMPSCGRGGSSIVDIGEKREFHTELRPEFLENDARSGDDDEVTAEGTGAGIGICERGRAQPVVGAPESARELHGEGPRRRRSSRLKMARLWSGNANGGMGSLTCGAFAPASADSNARPNGRRPPRIRDSPPALRQRRATDDRSVTHPCGASDIERLFQRRNRRNPRHSTSGAITGAKKARHAQNTSGRIARGSGIGRRPDPPDCRRGPG